MAGCSAPFHHHPGWHRIKDSSVEMIQVPTIIKPVLVGDQPLSQAVLALLHIIFLNWTDITPLETVTLSLPVQLERGSACCMDGHQSVGKVKERTWSVWMFRSRKNRGGVHLATPRLWIGPECVALLTHLRRKFHGI